MRIVIRGIKYIPSSKDQLKYGFIHLLKILAYEDLFAVDCNDKLFIYLKNNEGDLESFETYNHFHQRPTYYSLRPIKIVPFFYFGPSHKVCPISLFTFFGSGSHESLTHSYSHFIIKLIYKSRTHIPLTLTFHYIS